VLRAKVLRRIDEMLLHTAQRLPGVPVNAHVQRFSLLLGEVRRR